MFAEAISKAVEFESVLDHRLRVCPASPRAIGSSAVGHDPRRVFAARILLERHDRIDQNGPVLRVSVDVMLAKRVVPVAKRTQNVRIPTVARRQVECRIPFLYKFVRRSLIYKNDIK